MNESDNSANFSLEASHKRFEEAVIARRRAAANDNPMPPVGGNRHFLTEEEASRDPQTKELWDRYELGRFSGPNKPHFVPFDTFPHIADLKVQNLPMFMDAERNLTPPRMYEMFLESVLRYKAVPSFNLRVTCTDIVFGGFVRFTVTSTHPLHLNCDGHNHSYPIVMDREGFHIGDREVMTDYVRVFSRQSIRGQPMMAKQDRHYLTGGLPCNYLKIQVVDPSTEVPARPDVAPFPYQEAGGRQRAVAPPGAGAAAAASSSSS